MNQDYPSENQVAAWKAQYGSVMEIALNDGRRVWLRKPDRNVVSMAMTKARNSALGMAEVLLANCFLGGDDIREDAGALVGLQAVSDEIIGAVSAEVKNC